LAGVLPQLLLLQIGLCKHAEVVAERLIAAPGEAGQAANDGDWVKLYPGFADVKEVCEEIRPQLKVRVGYAQQWREDLDG
jgi:hypothetical protein